MFKCDVFWYTLLRCVPREPYLNTFYKLTTFHILHILSIQLPSLLHYYTYSMHVCITTKQNIDYLMSVQCAMNLCAPLSVKNSQKIRSFKVIFRMLSYIPTHSKHEFNIYFNIEQNITTLFTSCSLQILKVRARVTVGIHI